MTFSCQKSLTHLYCIVICLSVCMYAFCLCAIHVHLSMLCVYACMFLSVMCYVLCGANTVVMVIRRCSCSLTPRPISAILPLFLE